MALTLDDKLKSARIINQVAGIEDLPDWSRERYRQEDINPQGGNRGEGPTHQKEEQLSIPGLPLELAHDFWDGESLSDKWGAVVMPDGETWMIPTKEGTLRQATEEESIMLQEDRMHREQFNRNTSHPHQEGWDQANLYMGEQIPNNFDRILNPTGAPNPPRPSLDQLREGVKEKKRTGGISLAMGKRTARDPSFGNRSLMPDGNYGVPKEGMKVKSGGLNSVDYIFKGNKWVEDA